MKRIWIASVAFTFACGETDECRKLAELQQKYEITLAKAQSRAKMVPKLEERFNRSRTNTDRVLGDLGVDLPINRIRETLDARASTVKTASVTERDVRMGEGDSDGVIRHQWEITFTEKDSAKAWAAVEQLAALPPLMELATVIKEKGKDTWRVQLLKIDADRIAAEPKPVRIEPLDEADTVKSELGFCGAGDKRKAIAELKQRIDEVRSDAEKSTVLLPKIATLDGLLHRTEKRKQVEDESRRLMKDLFGAALKSKVSIKAVGYQEPLAILEAWGGPAERKKLTDQLSPLADKLKPLESPPGVVRLGLPNKNAAPHQRPPGHEGHEEPGHERHQEGSAP